METKNSFSIDRRDYKKITDRAMRARDRKLQELAEAKQDWDCIEDESLYEGNEDQNCYLPSEDEIAAVAASIQRQWSDDQRKSRQVLPDYAVEILATPDPIFDMRSGPAV